MLRLRRERKSIKFRNKRVEWEPAPDVKRRISHLVSSLELTWVKTSRIYSYRSKSAKTRAYARIWGFARLWQMALKENPAYIVEVISEKYDSLNDLEKDKVLLHELTHIPLNFSGSLLPHIRKGERNFEDKVRILISKYQNLK